MLCEGGPIHQTNLIRGHSQHCSDTVESDLTWRAFESSPQLLYYLLPNWNPEPTIIWLILYWITFISYNTSNHIKDLGGIWYSGKKCGIWGQLRGQVLALTSWWLWWYLESYLTISSLSCSALKWGWRHFWRAERKAAYGACPLHMPWDVGKPPKPPLQPDPWTHPYPHQLPPPQRVSRRARAPVTCSLSPLLQQEPNKALPGFPVWPLIIFHWLRRPTTLIGNVYPDVTLEGIVFFLGDGSS